MDQEIVIDEACLREVMEIDQAAAAPGAVKKAFDVELKDGRRAEPGVDYYTDFSNLLEEGRRSEDELQVETHDLESALAAGVEDRLEAREPEEVADINAC